MGSQVLRELAERGVCATGFERYRPGHERGAAGGETRIFRTAYKEGGQYVPLLRRARRAWEQLGRRAGTVLFEPVGALTVGNAADRDVRMIRQVAAQWSLEVDELDHAAAGERFGQHRLFADDVVLLDREGGLLHPGRAVAATAQLAQRAGATVQTDAFVDEIEETSRGVQVRYRQDGEPRVAEFDRVVVCTGPWITSDFPQLRRDVEIRRAVLSWYTPDRPGWWRPGRFPVGMRRSGPGHRFSFFPDVGGGVKVNLHVEKSVVDDPERPHSSVPEQYRDRVSAVVADCLRGLSGTPVRVGTYMEGYTADNHGIIGPLPGRPDVFAMGGFSGHGFKLAPVFAEAVVDLLLRGNTELPIDHLALSRLAAA